MTESDDAVSQGELVRMIRRLERTLEGVVLRAVYDVQMAGLASRMDDLRRTQLELQARADGRDTDDKRRNILVGVAVLGPVAGALFNYYLNSRIK